MGRPIRHGYMSKLVELECGTREEPRVVSPTGETPRDDFQYMVLEIGSWAGGSTVTFAEVIKKYNGGRGKVIAVDAWRNFHGSEHIEKKSHRVMEQALSQGKIFDLFWHNVVSAGYENIVIPCRGWSRDVLPFVRDESADMVFIDGSHFYSDVLNDLKESSRIVKDGGILCGDDLELQLHEVDLAYARAHRDNDSLKDPNTKIQFHPGVALAVGEFFSAKGGQAAPVSAWKGFWAMRKVGGGWQKIEYSELDAGAIKIPEHLMTNY